MTLKLVSGGSPAFADGCGGDATGRSEAGLWLDSVQFRQILDSLPQCIFWKDQTGRFRGCNAAAATALGQASWRDIEGLSDFDLHRDPMIAQYLANEDQKAMREGAPFHRRLSQGNGPSGTARWYETSKIPLRDRDDRVKGLLISYEDVTERERMLVHQQRLALMGEMIGNITHQWRQPLTALGLMAQNLRHEHETGTLGGDDLKAYMARIQRAIDRMSKTIDDFRDFFRPRQHQASFRPMEVIDGCIEVVGPSLKINGIELRAAGSREIEVIGCPGELSQIFINLIVNAKEAIMERRVEPGTIEIGVAGRDSGIVAATVEDNAGGIPDGHQRRIFEPYFTTKPQGMGIGLCIVKKIVEQHMGGSIRVENTGKGARFTVEWPAGRAI